MEDECQGCHKQYDPNRHMKIHYSDCGHSLCGLVSCDACFKVNFREHSRTYNCAVCKFALSRSDFNDKPRDEREYEKERNVRQKILAVCGIDRYNEELEDFPTREEYDAHLEKVEDLIERYLSSTNVQQIQADLEAYEKSNQSKIIARRIRKEQFRRVLRREAIIEDAIYDESKRIIQLGEEATALQREIQEEEESKKFQAKEMPECENFDSVRNRQKYELSSLEKTVRAVFLQASGCDLGAEERIEAEELEDGLNTLKAFN